jgi:hypothetical protein
VYWRIGHAQLTGGGGYSGQPASYIESFRANESNDLLFGASVEFDQLSRVLFQRDLTLTADLTNNNLDMAHGIDVAGYAVMQVANVGANTTLSARYTTRGTQDGLLLNHGPANAEGPLLSGSFALIPEAVREASDRYVLMAMDESSAGYRQATLSRFEGADMNVALPDAFPVTFNATDAPYTRPRYAFDAVAGASRYTFTSAYSPQRSSLHDFTIEVNPAWLEGTTQELVFPDLSQVDGFEPAWVPPSPLDANVDVSAVARTEGTVSSALVTTESGVNGVLPSAVLGPTQ